MAERSLKLEIRDMTKRYDNGDGVEHINLKIYEGEIVTMLGPSGCGKSTILRTIGGFLDVTDGDILIDNESIVKLPTEKRPTAMVFQSYNLWTHMTVYENLAFGLNLLQLFAHLLADFGVQSRERLIQQQYGGLEQQGTGNCDALLLAAGKLSGILLFEAGHAYEL